jgi:sulfoxide reductase heme-binding subunit YedZ
MRPSERVITAIRVLVFLGCLWPFARMIALASTDRLGANPVEAITRATGWWTLVLLLVTLSITPARRLLAANWLLKFRRMLGLFAFFYAACHLATYVWLEVWFDFGKMLGDILKRPFVFVGVLAFLLMLPLAMTSTSRMQRRLGRGWKHVHFAIYLIASLGILHFWWLVKRDATEPRYFALALAALLGVRLLWWWRGSQSAPRSKERTTTAVA